MRVSVIGCGYLGAVHAACLASLGHDVVGLDVDPARLARLREGAAPFYEPGLDPLLAEGVASGRLRFTDDYADLAGCDVHYLAVGTPQSPSGAADLRFMDAAVTSLLAALTAPASGAPVVIAGKSTVPVGTAARLATLVERAGVAATLVWNPEFLREGTAIADTLHPDRIVYGLPPDEAAASSAAEVLDRVLSHDDSQVPVVRTDYATAELVKVAANAFLATKVTFINAMADLCDRTGADVTELATALGLDERIGSQFLRAGAGVGGGCLPKDVRALVARSDELGAGESFGFLREVDALNVRQRERVVARAAQMLGGDVAGARVAVLGAAFKPESDDIRESPALAVADLLQAGGAEVHVTDPHAMPLVRTHRPALHAHDDVATAVADADLVVLATEWRELVALDPAALAGLVRHRRVLDARNALPVQRWRDAGWTYHGVGRR